MVAFNLERPFALIVKAEQNNSLTSVPLGEGCFVTLNMAVNSRRPEYFLKFPQELGVHPQVTYEQAANLLLRAVQIAATTPFQVCYIDKPRGAWLHACRFSLHWLTRQARRRKLVRCLLTADLP